MIQLGIDTKALISDLDNFLSGIKELQKPSVLDEISKAIFTITSEKFLIAADSYARANPKKMHHVYEWGQIGQPNGRLFVIERGSILNGSLVINSKFLPSNLPVPVNPELLNPGPTGKIVSKKNIFQNKAEVMESGSQVNFTAKKMLAFAGSEGIVFISPGKTINILNPGGKFVKNSFAEHMLRWYIENGNIIMESSGFYDKVSSAVAQILSSYKPTVAGVKNAIANVVNSSGLDRVVVE